MTAEMGAFVLVLPPNVWCSLGSHWESSELVHGCSQLLEHMHYYRVNFGSYLMFWTFEARLLGFQSEWKCTHRDLAPQYSVLAMIVKIYPMLRERVIGYPLEISNVKKVFAY
jgi:hypothetical protein